MGKDIENLSLQKENRQMEVDRNFISLMANESIAHLLDWIFQFDMDLKSIEDFEKYLWELYEKESYLMILAIIKSLHILYGLMIPVSLGKIIQGDKQELCSSFVYELLMDMNERIVDFENDI